MPKRQKMTSFLDRLAFENRPIGFAETSANDIILGLLGL